ncbi:hypothetical protein [Paenibacillus arenosi]|uniref:Uncharacterized protein n=1 Tax=Paenibacillus arenosi TaxID=2774142 RepID=A0ABR9AUM1_9BACL|nr:hypothetical protein [Paenibacillus arenosi]MBD8497712.1 hypothetical protein [Paenibacillus arenosi]
MKKWITVPVSSMILASSLLFGVAGASSAPTADWPSPSPAKPAAINLTLSYGQGFYVYDVVEIMSNSAPHIVEASPGYFYGLRYGKATVKVRLANGSFATYVITVQ